MIDFSSSFVQPVLGHSAQPTGKNQLTKGDSGVMPRKTEEADSFEKQPQPPANRVEKNTVVPTVVATAILSPLLGALAGEWVWQGLASDEKQSVNVPVNPNVSSEPLEKRILDGYKAQLLVLREMVKTIEKERECEMTFHSIENLSQEDVNTQIKGLLSQHHIPLTKKLMDDAIAKLGENSTPLNQFQTALDFIEKNGKHVDKLQLELPPSSLTEWGKNKPLTRKKLPDLGDPDLPKPQPFEDRINETIKTLHSTIAQKWVDYMPNCRNRDPSGMTIQHTVAHWSDWHSSLSKVIKGETKIDNALLSTLVALKFNEGTQGYPNGMLDTKFILESLQSEDEGIKLLNERLQQANRRNLDISKVNLPAETADAVVASSTTQTVEATVKEGVQTLKGLGNWVLKPTETLEKAGGEALEKHATTSRWIAGGVALTTLLLGGAFAFFASQKKPQNQSIDAN